LLLSLASITNYELQITNSSPLFIILYVCVCLSKIRRKTLLYSTLLAVVPRTVEWSPGVGIVMCLSCLFAVAIGRFAIKNRGVGPKLPIEGPALFEGFGFPELLGTMSLGHVLGAGIILGLTSAGAL
jgi:photosystem I subunit 10